jgi:uncharacterized protein (TIGR03083 family)
MIDFIGAVRSGSALFEEILRTGEPAAGVPSCPGWTLADLGWHLAEVQHFWSSIVEDLLDDPGPVRDLQRPEDAALADLASEQASRLSAALAARSPEDVCWSWHEDGGSVGWVQRRQAHEALIHRVDAELATGRAPALDPVLAVDGVDEILSVIIGWVPPWGRFDTEGRTAVIETTDVPGTWMIEFGRFLGSSPNSGKTYDQDAVRVVDPGSRPPDVVVRGKAADLDLWLWGRDGSGDIVGEGDVFLMVRLRAIAAQAPG